MPVEIRTLRRSRRRQRSAPSSAASALVAGIFLSLASAPLHAQSLLELYEAAHSYDATYLAARALRPVACDLAAAAGVGCPAPT